MPVFAESVAIFSEHVSKLRELASKQSRHTGGVADEKRQLREQMCLAAHELGAAVRACVLGTPRAELANFVDFSLTDLRIGKDLQCVERCRRIFAAASEPLPGLESFGVTPKKRAALEQLLLRFEAILHRPRQIRNANKEITAQLPLEFDMADDVLYNRLDNLLPQFRASDMRFYKAFIESRGMSQPVRGSTQVRPSEDAID